MIAVELAEAPTEDVRVLVQELEAELAANYPPEQRHGLRLEAIFQTHIRFVVASLDGVAAGCGGVACFAEFAELKRMYVRPAMRGVGVADAILLRLLEEASNAGLPLVRLETGTEQHAAIRFYTRHGFSQCGAFEPYASLPANRTASSFFMERMLA